MDTSAGIEILSVSIADEVGLRSAETQGLGDVMNGELLSSLTQEWIYRHQHYWSLLFRFGLVAAFVTAIPWLVPEVRAALEPRDWIFPVASLAVVVASTFFINEEWKRARSTYSRIKDLRGAQDPDYSRDQARGRVPRIGALLIVTYVAVLVAMNIGALLVLQSTATVNP